MHPIYMGAICPAKVLSRPLLKKSLVILPVIVNLTVMALSEKEIKIMLDKLRDLYGEYAALHSPSWFNIDELNSRYLHALETGMNLEAFVLAEVSHFEKLKARFEKKNDKGAFTQKVEKMMDDYLEQISRYPSEDFHPDACPEVRHLYGAMKDFALRFMPGIHCIYANKKLTDILYDMETRLVAHSLPRGDDHPRPIEDHCLVLARKDVKEIDVARSRTSYMKETAFLLNEIRDLCRQLLDLKVPEWEEPVVFKKQGIDVYVAEVFEGCTGYGVIHRIMEQVDQILNDFRLGAFKKKNQ